VIPKALRYGIGVKTVGHEATQLPRRRAA